MASEGTAALFIHLQKPSSARPRRILQLQVKQRHRYSFEDARHSLTELLLCLRRAAADAYRDCCNSDIVMLDVSFYVAAVIDGDISEVSLKNYRGQYVILFFYPKVGSLFVSLH